MIKHCVVCEKENRFEFIKHAGKFDVSAHSKVLEAAGNRLSQSFGKGMICGRKPHARLRGHLQYAFYDARPVFRG